MKTPTILILNLWVFWSVYLPPKTMPVQNMPTHFENSVSSGKALFEQNCKNITDMKALKENSE